MELIKAMKNAIDCMETHLTAGNPALLGARCACMSQAVFQQYFLLLTGMTVGEYIRKRRLTEAGKAIRSTRRKIIDIAYDYGYQSPESFSRAFSQFHGLSPVSVRKGEKPLRILEKIEIQLGLEGGGNMLDIRKLPYALKENRPVYHTPDLERTAQWFEQVLGWYAGIDGRDEHGAPVYGCAMPFPGELVHLRIADFNGIHLFRGEATQDLVTFMLVEGLDDLRAYVLSNGWTGITEIHTQDWGARSCTVTTVDGSKMTFFELV